MNNLEAYRAKHPKRPSCLTCNHGEERHARRECLTWDQQVQCECKKYVPNGTVTKGMVFAASWNDPRLQGKRDKVRKRFQTLDRLSVEQL